MAVQYMAVQREGVLWGIFKPRKRAVPEVRTLLAGRHPLAGATSRPSRSIQNCPGSDAPEMNRPPHEAVRLTRGEIAEDVDNAVEQHDYPEILDAVKLIRRVNSVCKNKEKQ